MAQTPTTSPKAPTALYQLVRERLGRDPVDFIRERRTQIPPVPYNRIADEIKALCNKGVTDPAKYVYITHEIPRRWYVAALQSTDDVA